MLVLCLLHGDSAVVPAAAADAASAKLVVVDGSKVDDSSKVQIASI